MTVTITLILLFAVPLVATALFLIFADRWLRGVDKQKYIQKSLKKQLKKGDITESEYEERLNPEIITVKEIVLEKVEPEKEEPKAKEISVNPDKE